MTPNNNFANRIARGAEWLSDLLDIVTVPLLALVYSTIVSLTAILGTAALLIVDILVGGVALSNLMPALDTLVPIGAAWVPFAISVATSAVIFSLWRYALGGKRRGFKDASAVVAAVAIGILDTAVDITIVAPAMGYTQSPTIGYYGPVYLLVTVMLALLTTASEPLLALLIYSIGNSYIAPGRKQQTQAGPRRVAHRPPSHLTQSTAHNPLKSGESSGVTW